MLNIAFMRVVFPVLVPPAINIFFFSATAFSISVKIRSFIVSSFNKSFRFTLCILFVRRVIIYPFSVTGLLIIFTRIPFGSIPSNIGLLKPTLLLLK